MYKSICLWVFLMGGISILFGGCSGESADRLLARAEAAAQRPESYGEARQYLTAFLKQYPDDPRADFALHTLARVAFSMEDTEEAVATCRELIRRFPGSRYADQTQLLIGYAYEIEQKYEEAREAYQRLIEQYPESKLVEDARVSIETLGKEPGIVGLADTTFSFPDKSGNIP